MALRLEQRAGKILERLSGFQRERNLFSEKIKWLDFAEMKMENLRVGSNIHADLLNIEEALSANQKALDLSSEIGTFLESSENSEAERICHTRYQKAYISAYRGFILVRVSRYQEAAELAIKALGLVSTPCDLPINDSSAEIENTQAPESMLFDIEFLKRNTILNGVELFVESGRMEKAKEWVSRFFEYLKETPDLVQEVDDAVLAAFHLYLGRTEEGQALLDEAELLFVPKRKRQGKETTKGVG